MPDDNRIYDHFNGEYIDPEVYYSKFNAYEFFGERGSYLPYESIFLKHLGQEGLDIVESDDFNEDSVNFDEPNTFDYNDYGTDGSWRE